MKDLLLKNKQLYTLLFIVAIINTLQCTFTPIARDTAYYWIFSQHLDWGYFDHPPMVALMIKIGYFIFHNTLGIGLMTIILSFFTYVTLWEFVPNTDKNKKGAALIFVLIIFVMPISTIYGFITTPDVPLLFFGVLYMYVFKQFIDNDNIKNAIKVGVIAALMVYSKYHGILVIILSLIPYYKLFLRRNLYVAGIIGLALLIPHLLWLQQHDFATIMYHINYRSSRTFLIKNILEYITNVILILNPFVSLPLFYIVFSNKIRLEYKSMKFIFWGFILFFGYSSLQNHVEPHWIAMAVIPTILYLHNIILSNNNKLNKIFLKLIYISIPIIIAARIVLILPLNIDSEFHTEKKPYYQTIANFVGDTNVIFLNSFSKPSKYTFYTGKEAFTTRTVHYHKTQYDFLNIADKYNHKPAYLIYSSNNKKAPHVDLKTDSNLVYKFIKDFHVITNLNIKVNYIKTIPNDTALQINITIHNPYNYDIIFNDSIKPYRLSIVKYINKKMYYTHITNNIKILKSHSFITSTERFYPENLKEQDIFGIAVSTNIFGFALLSDKYSFKIGEY